jgi:putative MFS transporter
VELLRRLERLPLTRVQLKLLLQGGVGYTFDAFDTAIVAFILTPVALAFHLSNGQTGAATVALLGSDTTGKSLERIAQELARPRAAGTAPAPAPADTGR